LLVQSRSGLTARHCSRNGRRVLGVSSRKGQSRGETAECHELERSPTSRLFDRQEMRGPRSVNERQYRTKSGFCPCPATQQVGITLIYVPRRLVFAALPNRSRPLIDSRRVPAATVLPGRVSRLVSALRTREQSSQTRLCRRAARRGGKRCAVRCEDQIHTERGAGSVRVCVE
jgi:hypothetical protein